jgi:hypothetical protein
MANASERWVPGWDQSFERATVGVFLIGRVEMSTKVVVAVVAIANGAGEFPDLDLLGDDGCATGLSCGFLSVNSVVSHLMVV